MSETYIKLDSENHLTPQNFPAERLAGLLTIIAQAVDGEDLNLIGIENNCVKLNFAGNACVGLAALMNVLAGLAPVTEKLHEPIKALQKWHKTDDKITMTLASPLAQKKTVIIQPEDNLVKRLLPTLEKYKYERRIYGKLLEAGGTSPNIHIIPLTGGKTITCDCSISVVKELASRIYEVIGVEGEYNANTDRLQLTRILPYQDSTKNPMIELKNKFGHYFEKTDVVEFMREVRGEDYVES